MKNIFLILCFFNSFFSNAQILSFEYAGQCNSPIYTSPPVSKTYATFDANSKSPNISLSNGNLTIQRNGGIGVARTTFPVTSGKWYWEMKVDAFTSAPDFFSGICISNCSISANLGSTAAGWGFVSDGGDYYNNGFIAFMGGSTYPAAVNDVFGFELDLQLHTLTIFRNNTAQTPTPVFTGLTAFYYPAVSVQGNAVTVTFNFGATAFTYTGHTSFNQGIYQ